MVGAARWFFCSSLSHGIKKAPHSFFLFFRDNNPFYVIQGCEAASTLLVATRKVCLVNCLTFDLCLYETRKGCIISCERIFAKSVLLRDILTGYGSAKGVHMFPCKSVINKFGKGGMQCKELGVSISTGSHVHVASEMLLLLLYGFLLW